MFYNGSVLNVTLFAMGINGITFMLLTSVLHGLISFDWVNMAAVEVQLQLALHCFSLGLIAWFSVAHFGKLCGYYLDLDFYLDSCYLSLIEHY